MTQKLLIMNHLLDGGSITQREAFNMFNITRLSAIIYYLRKMNLKIIDERVWTGTGYECKYYLITPERLGIKNKEELCSL